MNRERMLVLRETLIRNKKRFRYNVWWGAFPEEATQDTMPLCEFTFSESVEEIKKELTGEIDCGTCGCVGGWVLHLALEQKPPFDNIDIPCSLATQNYWVDFARHVLDLSKADANWLMIKHIEEGDVNTAIHIIDRLLKQHEG
jgi:hypothetical protein